MNIGAENRKKLILVSVLFAAAAFLFIRMLVGWNSASASVPPPTAPHASDFEKATANAPALPSPVAKRAKGPAQPSLDPRLQLNLLAQSENLQYKGAGRNIFDRESMPQIPTPLGNGKKSAPAAPPQPAVYTPPPPPPINLKFFGFANSVGEPKQVFLSQGEDVWVAKEGDTVNRRYKIVHINPNSVEIEDVLSNNRQTIPLTQG